MITPRDFYELLIANGVRFFAGVPDSLLKDFCAYVEEHSEPQSHIIAVNEGSAVALAAGHHLATGEIPLIYMQNSGLGNAINPLVSLADSDVYSLPLILLIGWRGEPGTKDEPQHVKMGEITCSLLETLDIPYSILSKDFTQASVEVLSAIEHAKRESRTYALVIQKDTFDTHTASQEVLYSLSREQAVEEVVSCMEPDAVAVSTTGKLSRELFEIRERRTEGHERDFLTVGSMGHASQIALGIAESQPSRKVYCFDGDGAVLMHMGGLATIGTRAPKNFRHIVFNNGMHESVGGQKTAAFDVDLCTIARACGYTFAKMVTNDTELRNAFSEMKDVEGPIFLEIRVQGGARDDLGRPTRTPIENKEDFENFLQG